MIKDIKMWEEFERKLIRESVSDYQTNSKIFEMMLSYAKSIGAFPPANPLEGIEVDIRIAKILNSRE
jgi:hypothetical protein